LEVRDAAALVGRLAGRLVGWSAGRRRVSARLCLRSSHTLAHTPAHTPRTPHSPQVFKFALYLAVPISLTAWVINGKASFESLREAREYVKYPSEDASHSFKDIESALNKAKQK